jgi:hypothetical protein
VSGRLAGYIPHKVRKTDYTPLSALRSPAHSRIPPRPIAYLQGTLLIQAAILRYELYEVTLRDMFVCCMLSEVRMLHVAFVCCMLRLYVACCSYAACCVCILHDASVRVCTLHVVCRMSRVAFVRCMLCSYVAGCVCMLCVARCMVTLRLYVACRVCTLRVAYMLLLYVACCCCIYIPTHISCLMHHGRLVAWLFKRKRSSTQRGGRCQKPVSACVCAVFHPFTGAAA